MMANINIDELRDRIAGCWMGKSIGGTLGVPYEGKRETFDVRFYSSPSGEPLPNDDLDLQLVWLKAAADRGPGGINSHLLAQYWLNLIPPPWNEYGIGKANLRVGLLPPLSGEYGNVWKHSNGAWIRSEIWACLNPGCPDLAIRYAYEDAIVDHGGGEGTYAELFTSSIQSAAFVCHDRDELIEIGLARIPQDCRVARSVRLAIKCWKEGKTWKEAREAVVADSADLGWFMAPANVAFFIIGWLYGDGDFGKSVCTAVNCGDDTDCTAATLGATLGILLGRSKLPAEWCDPIGDRIITLAVDRGSRGDFPQTISQLTEEVIELVTEFLRYGKAGLRTSAAPTSLADYSISRDSLVAPELWAKPAHGVEFDLVHAVCTVDYMKDPAIKAFEPFPLRLTFSNRMPDHRHIQLRFSLPDGWTASPSSQVDILLMQNRSKSIQVEITPSDNLGAVNTGAIEVQALGRPASSWLPLVFLSGL